VVGQATNSWKNGTRLLLDSEELTTRLHEENTKLLWEPQNPVRASFLSTLSDGSSIESLRNTAGLLQVPRDQVDVGCQLSRRI
jgi:hypothetical protein